MSLSEALVGIRAASKFFMAAWTAWHWQQVHRATIMKQTKHLLAIGAAVLVALTAVPLAVARGGGHGGGHYGGGHGGGGHGGGGHGFAHHASARSAFRGGGVRAFRGPTGHARGQFANRGQHLAHVANHHQFADHHQLVNHNQLATQNLRNGLVQNGLVRNGLGNRQLAHNQFWGRGFGAHGFRHGNGFFWAGPVFWPFAFGDIFSFAFWPYYDPFWDYGPDFIVASLYWPYGADDYAHYGPYYSFGDIYTGSRQAPVTTSESSTDVAESCGGVAPGLTELPMDRIEKTLQPSPEQRPSFDDLKAASVKAAEIMKTSCPTEIPLTPISRLDAVEKRVDTMIQAVQILRAPLDTFYDSLTDAQKRHLDSLAESQGRNRADSNSNLAEMCSESARQFTALPSEQIQQTVQPNEQQRGALEALKSASTKAADILNGTCPSQTPSTPGARLDAMAKRLDATVQAVKTMRPALKDFYASLGDEQKARFNTMNQQAQRQG
jgi:hypothetical protein